MISKKQKLTFQEWKDDLGVTMPDEEEQLRILEEAGLDMTAQIDNALRVAYNEYLLEE